MLPNRGKFHMLEKGQISSRQFGVILCLYTIGNAIIYSPSQLIVLAKQDAWLSIIIGLLAGMLLIFLYSTLGGLFPNLNFAQYSEQIFGRFFGKLAALLVLSFVYISTLYPVWGISDFLATRMLSNTPIEVIISITIIMVTFSVILGLETISRVGEILFPWTLLFLFLVILMLIPQMKLIHFLPIMDEGIKPTIRGGVQFLSFPLTAVFNFLMLLPYAKHVGKAKKAYYLGTLIGAAVIWIVTIANIAVLGVPLALASIYPTYDMAQKINIGDFLQRVEAIVAIIWFVTQYFYTVLNFYITTLILAQILGLKEYRPLVLPLGVITVPLANVLIPNIPYSFTFTNQVWPAYAFTVTLLLPLLMLLIAKLRRMPKSSKKPET
ncbi:endospore germination permease [Paenibacillus sp. 5J-6]|uniref:Endospore germination permease n=1 Tax=Paenibacillus silvestris TaxID=2606219 RepID=A0A6L8V167_9BACL|nr:endospore germination permease [Paenibacillus silvestris]MZQ84065.1 endospore germination permease [Paenibacillus silvestris]